MRSYYDSPERADRQYDRWKNGDFNRRPVRYQDIQNARQFESLAVAKRCAAAWDLRAEIHRRPDFAPFATGGYVIFDLDRGGYV